MKEIPFHVTRQRERTKKKGTKNRRKGRKQPGGTRRKLFLASNKIQIHKKKESVTTSNTFLPIPAISRKITPTFYDHTNLITP